MDPTTTTAISFIDDHPTHWDVRDDIRSLSDYIAHIHGCSWNSYWDHPPGYALDATSVDFWGENGRGDPVGLWRGHAIWGRLFYEPGPPLIRWIIWQGWMWDQHFGWQWFSEDEPWADMGHFRHVHVTFE